MANSVFSASGMDFQYVSGFDWLWGTVNDHYPGDHVGSFWAAQVPDDTFRPFGSLCIPQTATPTGTCMLIARSTPGNTESKPPLAAPSSFELVWNDKGTGNTKGSGACWQMQPPTGYVALGTVFNNDNYNEPTLAHYWCIRQDLVAALGQPGFIWNDGGTGATFSNLQCYGVNRIDAQPSNSGPGEQTPVGSWALDAGSFLTGNNYYSAPPGSPFNVIVLPSMGQLLPSASSPPALSPNVNIAPAAYFGLAASMEVLFPMIVDPDRDLAWQIDNPIYTIEIWAQWSNVISLTTEAGSGTLSKNIQSGIQNEDAINWSNQVGVSASVSDTAEVSFIGTGDKLQAGVTASYSHTWGGSEGTITSTVSTVSASVTVPPETFSVLWQLNYQAYLRREDGTYVGALSGTSRLNGYSLLMGTASYQATTASFQSFGIPVSIGSAQFSKVSLGMDGSGVTKFMPNGGGVVNCQFNPTSHEKFTLVPQGDGTVAIQSAQSPGVYLRMDGIGGVVNCQFGVGSNEKFWITAAPST